MFRLVFVNRTFYIFLYSLISIEDYTFDTKREFRVILLIFPILHIEVLRNIVDFYDKKVNSN